jgi:ABC-2 type transport system permease protein
VAGLASGCGPLFPRFETENAAQMPTAFGGWLFMMSSIAVIAGVVILEARPVIGYLRARAFGDTTDPVAMAVGFGLAALLCVAATVVPIRVALRRLESVER